MSLEVHGSKYRMVMIGMMRYRVWSTLKYSEVLCRYGYDSSRVEGAYLVRYLLILSPYDTLNLYPYHPCLALHTLPTLCTCSTTYYLRYLPYSQRAQRLETESMLAAFDDLGTTVPGQWSGSV